MNLWPKMVSLSFLYACVSLISINFLNSNCVENDTSISVEAPPPLEHDSDFTIVFDKEEGFKRVPLNEINFDEVAPAFDIENDVRFELFTPKNPNQPQLLTLDNFATVKKSHFNWWYPTRYNKPNLKS